VVAVVLEALTTMPLVVVVVELVVIELLLP
jgi:hypothetical protein